MATKAPNLPALIVDNYPVFNKDMAGVVAEVITTNLGDDFQLRDLERVKVPSGGGTVWQVPTPEGEENRETLSGIIVGQINTRAFWKDDMNTSGGGTPPDCWSPNMVRGIGSPGGECGSCPFNSFGSAKEGKGRGKACKEVKNVLVLLEGSMLPIVLQVPSTSLKGYKQYNVKLSSGGKGMPPAPYYGVMTHFTLKKTNNKDGIVYSEIIATRGDMLPAEQMPAVKAYHDQLMRVLTHAVESGQGMPDFENN